MKLTETIHQLRIDFEITISPERKIPGFVNVLIILGKNITLIDTGIKNSEKKIFDYIRQIGRDISEIKTVEKLGLPSFLANPVVNRAFMSHLT